VLFLRSGRGEAELFLNGKSDVVKRCVRENLERIKQSATKGRFQVIKTGGGTPSGNSCGSIKTPNQRRGSPLVDPQN